MDSRQSQSEENIQNLISTRPAATIETLSGRRTGVLLPFKVLKDEDDLDNIEAYWVAAKTPERIPAFKSPQIHRPVHASSTDSRPHIPIPTTNCLHLDEISVTTKQVDDFELSVQSRYTEEMGDVENVVTPLRSANVIHVDVVIDDLQNIESEYEDMDAVAGPEEVCFGEQVSGVGDAENEIQDLMVKQVGSMDLDNFSSESEDIALETDDGGNTAVSDDFGGEDVKENTRMMDGIALRKGQRRRFKPLAFWRNERLVYGRRESSARLFLPAVLDVLTFSNDDSPRPRTRKTYRSNSTKQIPRRTDQISVDRVVGPVLLDGDEKNRVKSTKPYRDAGFTIATTFVSGDPDRPEFISGKLVLPADGGVSRNPDTGSVTMVTLHSTMFVASMGSEFHVPPNNQYELLNISNDSDTVLFYMSINTQYVQ